MMTTLKPVADAVQDAKERLFQCSTCKRSFTRVDHLMRHVRSHTKQRPYICQTCGKGFARVDLLKRHSANHSSDNPNKRQKPDVVRQARVVQACEACSQHHLRCEDDKPCSRCQKRNIPCKPPASAQDGTDGVQDELNAAARDLVDLSNNLGHSTMAPTHHQGLGESMNAGLGTIPPVAGIQDSSDLPPDANIAFYDGSGVVLFDNAAPSDSFLPEFLRNMHPINTSLAGFSGAHEPGEIGFDWSTDLSNFDSGFLVPALPSEPFTDETLSSIGKQDTEQPHEHEHSHEAAAVRAEAFKHSVWRYMPPPNDNPVAAGESNLAISERDRERDARLFNSNYRVIQDRMTPGTRDKLLALVLSNSNPANLRSISAGFPSLELLDSMVQVFCASPALETGSWIHLPTFSPNKMVPELMACIVASGAVCTPEIPLQKLGLALQEASRIGIGKVFDIDNAAIRDLQYLQVQILQNEIGMWSGRSRKMEIAESFLNPAVTMLRRGNRFRRATWKVIVPLSDEEGAALHQKWMEWVSQESWIRLVYRIFELDRQSSMALLKTPLISSAEMRVPLPQPDSLWYAPSASAWKAAYFANPTPSLRPALSDCLHNLENSSTQEAAAAHLYVVWGMIWEYRQMATLISSSSSQHHHSAIKSQYDELSKLCGDFRANKFASNKHIEFTLEMMLLHLNAPMNDIQTFAGIAGPEEARLVYPSLKAWTKDVSCRQALWHAAQILSLSDALPIGILRNFYAMSLYHAALALWTYGLLNQSTVLLAPGDGSAPIDIGGEYTFEIQRFIKFDLGQPVLRRAPYPETSVPLTNPSEVVRYIILLLKQNHDAVDGSPPSLVESLVQLLEGLRSATR